MLKAKDTLFSKNTVMNLHGAYIETASVLVMGILNVTNDSFFSKSRVQHEGEILSLARKMIDEGADILDIGGYSSRPGAEDIPREIEEERVVNAAKIIRAEYPQIILSVDTFRASVAAKALEVGYDIVNDISGGQDPEMWPLLAKAQVPYICMHMRGTPQTMQSLTHYEDIIAEIVLYFQQKKERLFAMGVKDLVIDPGFGFAKTLEQNYFILKNLDYFQVLECPLLVGLSRKSMIYKVLGGTADDALNGTTVLHTIALSKGANILRVHDVKAAKEAVILFKQMQK